MKRWPIIRHVRWFFLVREFNRWWEVVGSRYWLIPNPRDIEYLERVWRGEA